MTRPLRPLVRLFKQELGSKLRSPRGLVYNKRVKASENTDFLHRVPANLPFQACKESSPRFILPSAIQ